MKLYFYTFPANYEDQLALGREPMLKIGQTTQDCAETRVLQQMGTATAQQHELKAEFEVEFTDHDFHHFIQERGITRPDGQGTEWFYVTVEAATELLHEFAAIHGGIAMPIRQPLQPRPYQNEFVEQFCRTEGDFLLFAKCRSGKSVMGLMAATAADFRSLLVVSLRTSAANSWLNDPETFTVFHEWDAIDLHDADAIERIKASQKAGRRTLMVGTVQGADDKYPLQRQLKRIFPDGMDALFLDECHIGGLADMVQKLKDSIDFGRVLEISGTAFKAAWFYDKENTFVWDYTKEQAANLGLPRLNLTVVNYAADELSQVYGDDPDRLNNLWTVVDGEWQDAASVRNFFTGYFAHGRMTHKRKQLLHGSDHIVMSLPSVAACELAVQTVEELGLPWAPISITGASGNDQASILKHVNSHERTICFTRWANVVGVTVPHWDTVIHGAKTDSAEFWVQFSFRGGSTRRDSWRVIDFVPEQALSSVIEMVQAATDAAETTEPGQALKTFLDFADVHEFDTGFTQLDFDGFLDLSTEDVTSAIDQLNRRAIRLGTYGEYTDELAKAFNGASAVKDVTVIDSEVNSNGTANLGNTKLEASSEATKDELKALLKRIKGALEAVPAVVAIHAVEEPITSVFQLLDSPYLKTMTGVDREGFETAIAAKWISARELSSLVAHASIVLERA